MKTAAAYIRVSTEEQTELSPDSQIKLIQDYAKNHDMILPKEFIFKDEGISGRNTSKRPAFNQMIGIAKSKPKPFDCILLWKFSRFARNREDSIVYKSMLRKQLGIEVISISENIGDDKMSILIEALIEAMDEYYSVNLGEEVKRGLQEKFSRGQLVSSPPLGYKVVSGLLVPDEDAKLVRRIYHMYLNGDTCMNIALTLNAEGKKTKKGNSFDNRGIKYILMNPTYIGKLRWSTTRASKQRYRDTSTTQIVDGPHKPIIDKETYNKVADLINKNAEAYLPRYPKNKHYIMLRGLVKCSNCGNTLVYGNKGLQCHAYCKGMCTVSHYISLQIIDKAVIDSIEKFAISTNIKISTERIEPKRTPSNNIEAQINKEKIRLEKIKAAYMNGVDSLEEYKSYKSKIIAEIERLKQQQSSFSTLDIEKFRGKIRTDLEKIKSDSIDVSEKNIILRSFIKKIIFNAKTRSIEIFYHY